MGARILLVEDDPISRDVIQVLCEGRGASVDTATDGFMGLRLLSERRHDIVLIDYHLPEMDGYALARLMREIARPEGRVRLVGITADRHGLASRRGADTLFDGILVKPLEPETLFTTLDRLAEPEPPILQAEAGDSADALWRRRGLSGRPKALLCPNPTPTEAAAVSQAFHLTGSLNEADVVLVSGEMGLDGLRALRADGPAGLLPSVDLTGRLGAACDLAFQVGDPGSWSALARTCRAFDLRRGQLAPSIRSAADAPTRLLALLFVADRDLTINSTAATTSSTYETGYPLTSRMAAVLSLADAGLLSCEPATSGIIVRLTEVGRRAATQDDPAQRRQEASTVAQGVRDLRRYRPAEGPPRESAPQLALPWQEPKAIEKMLSQDAHVLGRDSERLTAQQMDHDSDDSPALVNERKLDELRRLIGSDHVERLLTRLTQELEIAFAEEANAAAIAHEAHVLISMAGSLGFDRLSRACRSLEAVIATGGDVSHSLNEARQAVVDVRALRRGDTPVDAGRYASAGML